ncbi:MAG TPA: hypothetical protein VF062_06175 [Candidatus Limnocylindrales bacterium]
MATELEQRLERVLSAAAGMAPEPEDDFTARVTTRTRHRRRVRAGMVTAAAVVAVAGIATPFAIPDGVQRQDATQVRISPGPPVDVTTARPAEELWPDAVVRLPATLPDGRPYSVAHRLPDGRFLIAPFGVTGGYFPPEVLDATTGQSTKLMPDNPSLTYMGGIQVGPTLAVWLMQQGTATTAPIEVWAAPLSGGPATRRGVFDPQQRKAYMARGYETGGSLYLTVSTTAGPVESNDAATYRLGPDGAMNRVEVADGLTITDYNPWLKPTATAQCSPLPSAGRCVLWQAPFLPVRFFNLETIQWRTPLVAPEYPEPNCHPEWCFAHKDDVWTAYRFDGRGAVSLSKLSGDRPRNFGVSLSRFTVIMTDTSPNIKQYLWDLKTNTVGVIPDSAHFPANGMWHDFVGLRTTGTEIVMLDLARIP